MNPKGTAILKPGQYVDAYHIGYYRNTIALRQVGPVSVYRDDNLDDKIDSDYSYSMDENTVETGLFGLHIHAAGGFSRYVDFWSAGCQVFQRREDLISMCRDFLTDLRPYSYTLVEI